MLAAFVCLGLWSPTDLSDTWTGDFVITIRGKGRVDKPKPSWADWDINRESRGTIIFDRTFKGAAIARTEDSKNLERYETWLADKHYAAQIKAHDAVHLYGPLFEAHNHRFDTSIFNCPPKSAPTPDGWQKAEIMLPILQLDYGKNEFLFEMPTIYGKGHVSEVRKFVKGDKKWTSTKPHEQIRDVLDFSMITGLNAGDDWAYIRGSFKKGQDTIDLSRKFTIKAKVGMLEPNPLQAEIKLVLKRIRK